MANQQNSPTRELKKRNLLGPIANVYASSNTGSWRIERPFVDQELCIACGTCSRYCPADVVTVDKDAAEKVTFNWDYCKGCGICANECPKKAITMINEKEAKA